MPTSTVLSNGNGSWILNLTSLVEDEDPQSLHFTTIPELTEISIRGKYYGLSFQFIGNTYTYNMLNGNIIYINLDSVRYFYEYTLHSYVA